ncbi:hypothetical protein SAMN06309945_1891 [Okibacterium fritillariae]|uniref:Uncharacterized protein n=1 Tax=Okibacterium fritillariae TaxID=123320 RepID=A0A1T5JV67_9MICO|nr:hypothetical protein SAMN06309945_1891 [Okibacterium fritillariae]
MLVGPRRIVVDQRRRHHQVSCNPFGVLFGQSLQFVSSNPIEVVGLHTLRDVGVIVPRTNRAQLPSHSLLFGQLFFLGTGIAITAGGASVARPQGVFPPTTIIAPSSTIAVAIARTIGTPRIVAPASVVTSRETISTALLPASATRAPSERTLGALPVASTTEGTLTAVAVPSTTRAR